MERNIDLSEVSDGKLYGINDMAVEIVFPAVRQWEIPLFLILMMFTV